MSALLTGRAVREELRRIEQDQRRAGRVVPLRADDAWEEDPEPCPVFSAALQAVVNLQADELEMDPTLSEADDRANMAAFGVREARFGVGRLGPLWHVQVNFSYSRQGKLPPGYMSVRYKDKEVAILGPWLLVRTCWQCGLKGWDPMWLPQIKRGRVLPDHPCPDCGTLDWFDRSEVKPEDLQQAAALELAPKGVDRAHEDRIYKETNQSSR